MYIFPMGGQVFPLNCRLMGYLYVSNALGDISSVR